MSQIKETFFHGELRLEVKRERLESRSMHFDVFHPTVFGAKGKLAGSLELDCQTGSVNWYDPQEDTTVKLFGGGEPNRCVICTTQIETGDVCQDCHHRSTGEYKGTYLVWTTQDHARAQAEGWDIFDAGAHGHEIERDEITPRFEDDNAAIDYVVHREKHGSQMHRRALAIHETGVCVHVAIVEGEGGAYFLGPRATYPVWYEQNPGRVPCPACDGDYELMWVPEDPRTGQLEWDDGAIVQVEMDRIDPDVQTEALGALARLKMHLASDSWLSTLPPEPACKCKKGGTK